MNSSQLVICIGGKNEIAITTAKFIQSNYPQIMLCGITYTTDNGTDSYFKSYKKFLSENNIPQVLLSDIYKLQNLIFLSLEFDKIIKPNLFISNRLYNIHFSLLPAYKGMYTSIWPILNGETHTGVTLHKINRGIDTGDIAEQIKIKIDPEETVKTLYKKYMNTGTELIKENIDTIIKDELSFRPQSAEGSTYYSKKTIDFKNLSIDLNVTASMLHTCIRAFAYREYQIPQIAGCHVHSSVITDKQSQLVPGSIVEETETAIELSTVDFNILLYKDKFIEVLAACKDDDILSLQKYFHKHYLEEQTTEGWTPLMVACYNNALNCACFLLKNGANVNAVNFKGTSVLMYAKDGAIKSGRTTIADVVLSYKPDIFLKDYNDKTVFDYLSGGSLITEQYIKSNI